MKDNPSKLNEQFDFDIQEIKKAIESGIEVVPKIDSVEDFDQWLETV